MLFYVILKRHKIKPMSFKTKKVNFVMKYFLIPDFYFQMNFKFYRSCMINKGSLA